MGAMRMLDGVKSHLDRARDLAARRADEVLAEKALTRDANERAAELTGKLRDAKVASVAAALDFGLLSRRCALVYYLGKKVLSQPVRQQCKIKVRVTRSRDGIDNLRIISHRRSPVSCLSAVL